MDVGVSQPLRLLRKAGRLDLLAEGVAGRARPARRAASSVAAAVATCSPPRGTRLAAWQASVPAASPGRATGGDFPQPVGAGPCDAVQPAGGRPSFQLWCLPGGPAVAELDWSVEKLGGRRPCLLAVALSAAVSGRSLERSGDLECRT
ncbi:hypothetical protein NDU88_002259 [Pleurodeles waltl]|uniref:Uncharacterized protein n=1 Tax=Pleurodeles waltl TaxID=8319 RepID=A0AAV7M0Z1_PLEWA|nr:hypothetical protein NDU88_002259 [Pleurodeles waltl]